MRHPSDVLVLDPYSQDEFELDRSGGPDTRLCPGSAVEVRCRFDRTWSRGFRVDEVNDLGVFLRRVTDDALLPVAFDVDDVRLAAPRR